MFLYFALLDRVTGDVLYQSLRPFTSVQVVRDDENTTVTVG
jgi:hypothetical protein